MTTTEAEKLATDILADEAWFAALPTAMKDHLSQPNHNVIQAEKGLRLARLVAGQNARTQSGATRHAHAGVSAESVTRDATVRP